MEESKERDAQVLDKYEGRYLEDVNDVAKDKYYVTDLKNAFKYDGFSGTYLAPKKKVKKASKNTVKFFKTNINGYGLVWGLIIT